jgi:hypothetical protein
MVEMTLSPSKATSRDKRSVQACKKEKTAIDNSQAVHYTNDTKNMVTVAQ